jgi:ubiquinol-cytochrome c reductase cytochrome b subunit
MIANNRNLKLRGEYRIGPHNIIIISILFGSLLGDAHAEKRSMGKGTKITFFQEATHVKYLLYLHRLVSNLGYCNTNIPKISTRLGVNSKVRYIVRFGT